MKRKKLLIGGKWRETKDGFEIKSPYTGKTIAEVSAANRDEAEESIAAAEDAGREMRKLARFETAKGLRAVAQGIEDRKKEFAETIALEAAKPIKLNVGNPAGCNEFLTK